MKYPKQLKRALRRLKTPQMHAVLPSTARADKKPSLRPRSQWLTAPVLVLFAILLIGCAAVPVIIGKINTGWITGQSGRLTEVPEGYTALYSAEDLVQMSRDVAEGSCAEYYILMNDITFTPADFADGGICEGGWDPIELNPVKYYHFHEKDSIPEGYVYGKAYGTPYIKATLKNNLKVFNGNGYVIRGLQITVDAAAEFARHAEYDYACPNIYAGLFGRTSDFTQIIHLGMEDTRITVTGADLHTSSIHTLHVGTIAGKTYYTGACYVKNTDIRIELTTSAADACTTCERDRDHGYELAIGPLVGTATYLDACYAEAYEIDALCNGTIPFYPHVGALAGMAQTTLTSWHHGTVSIAGNAVAENCQQSREHFEPWAYGDLVPIVLTMEHFDMLNEKAIAVHGEDTYEHRLIKSYYMLKDPSKMTSARQIEELNTVMKIWDKMIAHHTGNYETKYDAYYLFDPTTTGVEEIARAAARFRAVFPSDEEYRAFCDECNIKIGDIYCYEITDGTKVRQRELEGFDFDEVWIMQNGRPRLRIFTE